MQRTSIPLACAQDLFASAPNAAQKGLSQFYTPLELGRALAGLLPEQRPVIVDLTCGNGQLLRASANETTGQLLGSDLDPTSGKGKGKTEDDLVVNRMTCDLTVLYPWLEEVEWVADLFVLNPPWRLWWHRDRLAALGESDLPAVVQAFRGLEAEAPAGTIDSTVATLLIALDRCTTYGEGFLIANNSTLERLIFGPGAPHSAVAEHCWLRLVIPGNPMTGLAGCQWKENEPFETGVVYFARSHPVGPTTRRIAWPSKLDREWRSDRLGGTLRSVYLAEEATVPRWELVKQRAAEAAGRRKAQVPWNAWLAEGVIRTALSDFEGASRKLNKAEAQRLFALDGSLPMQMVLQRAHRDELLHVAERAGWRVQPELQAAIREAIRQYESERSPLYPLSPIQRLGYCDENEWMECVKPLGPFRPGVRYPLRTQTVTVLRRVEKPNSLTGEPEELEYQGHELAFFLTDRPYAEGVSAADRSGPWREYSFLEAKLLEGSTEVSNARQGASGVELPEEKAIDFTLQQLVESFLIPEVPDVAVRQPGEYRANLTKLAELEKLQELNR